MLNILYDISISKKQKKKDDMNVDYWGEATNPTLIWTLLQEPL